MARELGAAMLVGFESNTNAWNSTVVAVGADGRFDITSEGITGGPVPIPDNSLGYPHGSFNDPGAEGWRGPVTFDLFYGGRCGKFISHVLGSDGTASGGSTSQTHISDLQDSLTRQMTLVMGKRASASPWEWGSAKCSNFTMRVGGEGQMEGEMTVICHSRNTTSTTNNSTTIDTLTFVTNTTTGQSTAKLGRTLFTHGVFRLNAQAGGALGASDAICIRDIELTINRNMAEVMGACGTTNMVEPFEEGGFVETMLRVDLLDYNQETFVAAWGQKTEYKADFVLTGPTAGDANATYTFSFPRLAVADSPQAPVGGPGVIPHSVTFKCIEATTAPTGMSGITKPVRLVTVDQDATDYFV